MSQPVSETAFERFIDRVGSLPGVATILTAIVAAYMSLVAFGNITDFDSNQAFVHHVLEMDTTFNDPDVMWRAVENDTLQNIGYIGVIAWETLAAVVLIWATVKLIKAARQGTWRPAKRLASCGLLMVLFLFGFGFITMGGEYFSMWQSSDWNGLDAALRNYLLAAVPLILLQLPHPSWDEN